MEIKKEDIRGIYTDNGGIVCAECMTDEDWKDLQQDQIITEDMIEKDDDTLYFCDRCKKQL